MNSLRSGSLTGKVGGHAESRRLALKPPRPKQPKAKTPFGQIMQDFMTERGIKSEFGSELAIEPDDSPEKIKMGNARSPVRQQISPHSFAGILGGHILKMKQLHKSMEKPIQTMNIDVSEDMSYFQALAISRRADRRASPAEPSFSLQSDK